MKQRAASMALLFLFLGVALGKNPVQNIKVGEGPTYLRLSPDGRNAVVTCYAADEIQVIDVPSRKVVQKAKAGPGPLGLAFSLDGKVLYVSSMDAGVIKVFSFPGLILQDTLKVGNLPTDLALTPDGYYLVAANFSKSKFGRVDFIDLDKKRVIESANVGVKPLALTVSPSGDKVFVANSAEQEITIISTETGKPSEKMAVGDGPDGLAINRNGRKLYVAHARSNDLWVLDTRRKTVLRKIGLPDGPFRVALSPDERMAAVACCQADQVAFVPEQLVGEVRPVLIKTGRKPTDIVFSADGKSLWVTCEGSNCVSIVPVPDMGPSQDSGQAK